MATRIDSWIWAIRLYKTRSAAGAACRAGHVNLNGSTAKPSAQVAIGDRVSVRVGGRERIVEVAGLISKRASASIAAENYIDHSPPPPPREVIAAIPRRDAGAGRPTKRERRQLDQFRGGAFLIGAFVVVLALAGCSGADSTSDVGGPAGGDPTTGAGPDFERCGGLSTKDVADSTGLAGLELAIDNPSTCEWRANAERIPTVSFNWYRGSPIGRERGTIQLSRDSVRDQTIGGRPGFVGYDQNICEVGVSWDADFIEISVHAGEASPGVPQLPIVKICDGATALARIVVERAA